MRSAVTMRLKENDYSPSTRADFRGCQSRFDFGWVVTVIINDEHTAYFTFELKPSARACKTVQRFSDPGERNVQFEAYSDSGKRVVNIVQPRNAQSDLADSLPTAPNSEDRPEVLIVANSVGRDVCLGTQPVSHPASLNVRNNCLYIWVVETQHGSAIERHLVHEICETGTNIIHVVVVIHVFAVDICHDGNRRGQH